MKLRQILISTVMGASVLAVSMVYAAPSASTTQAVSESVPQVKMKGKELTEEERAKLVPIVQSLKDKMGPLMREQKALKMQLQGKITTQGTKMADVQPIIDQMSRIQKQMMTLRVQAQLQAYQEVGVMLPDGAEGKRGKHNKKN